MLHLANRRVSSTTCSGLRRRLASFGTTTSVVPSSSLFQSAKTNNNEDEISSLIGGRASYSVLLGQQQQSAILPAIHRNTSFQHRYFSKKRRGRRRKRGKNKEKFQHEEPPSRTHGDNGRLIMTKEIMQSDPLTEALFMNGRAKNYLNNVKEKMMVHLENSHVAEGPRHEQFFYSTTTMTVPADVALMKNGPPLPVQLMSTGAARSKKQAEILAALDLLLQLREYGIDERKPPDVRALRKAEEKERFKMQVQRAQMLLELFQVSRPHYETIQMGGGNFMSSSVTLYYRGIPLTAEGAPGRSKAEAQGNAIIAAAGAPLEMLVGKERIDQYESLLQASPADHLAALHVPPLPDEALEKLVDTMGSRQDHLERMKKHAEIMAEFQARFNARHLGKGSRESSSRRRTHHRQSSNTDGINRAFLQEEEETRLKKALEDPDGKQGTMKAIRDALPIKEIQEQLLEALRTQQVAVVSGGTGSGKSTQCPQYILEDRIANGHGAETRIIVTQPRRIAAISVAERIAAERDEAIGNSVGYTVRFNRQAPREVGGSIEFVTTGVLLRRLVNDPQLEGISHVMIDEVHERDIDTDFLLVLLRDLLTERPELRVILMSATLDAESFAKYFSRQGEQGTTTPAALMSVPPKPRYPVEVIHLEDLAGESDGPLAQDCAIPLDLQGLAQSLLQLHDGQLQLELEEADAEEAAAAQLEARSLAEDEGEASYESDSDSNEESVEKIRNESTVVTGGALSRPEALRHAVSMRNAASGTTIAAGFPRNQMADKREIEDLTVSLIAGIVRHVTRIETDAGRKGSILCFLPGWDEIKEAAEVLEGSDPSLKSKMTILPLHSTIPQEDQQKVFIPAPDGSVKVILATNIAESSVTIDDVLAVVDSGLVREMNFDAENAMSRMETVPTSRASATQRLGRAGRVAPGRAYRLYSRGALQAMLERPMPEIQRTALEATCLQTCTMTSTGVQAFLQRAMDPPSDESVSFAMERLIKLRAINVDPANGSEQLSALGRCLSLLPLDPATGRMLIMGCVMQCLDPVLTAAACFSSRDVFHTPSGMRDEQRLVRRSFCDVSDQMASVRAYEGFQSKIQEDGWWAAKDWAFENFVSVGAINAIQSVRSQLLDQLVRIGLVHKSDLLNFRSRKKRLRSDAVVNRNSDLETLYSAVWAAGLPDNLASRRQHASFGTLRTRMVHHAGLHPSSVAFYRKPPVDKSTKLPSWFLYREMALTSQVFLRGCTALDPEQIVLFGGYTLDTVDSARVSDRDELGVQDTSIISVLDDWIVLKSPCDETIEFLSGARNEIEAALDYKVMNPRKPLPEASQSMVDAVCDMYSILEDERDDEREADTTVTNIL